jgi:hypothetical protein
MNWSNFIALLLAVSVIVLFSRSCKKDEEYASLQMKYEQAVKIKDSLGRTISVKDAEIVQNQESMKELRAKLFETTEKYNKKVKEVKALIAKGTEVIIKDKPVPYIDTPKMKRWEDSVLSNCRDVIHYYEENTVPIGTSAKDSNQHYVIDMTVEKTNIKLNTIKFIDSQYIALTEMKGGFFKRNTKGKLKFYLPSKVRVEIKHTNPYFENKNIDAFFYESKSKNTYGRGIVHGAAGALLLGVLLILSP